MSYSEGEKLHRYILSLPDFHLVAPEEVGGGGYNHMGAIVVDSILQAHANWETVVQPRVELVLRLYGDLPTTSDFYATLTPEGADPHETLKQLLRWNGDEKPKRILLLLENLIAYGIETAEQFKEWLETDSAEQSLRTIHGIGPKTVDYLKILVGVDAVAIDVWWERLLFEADVSAGTYQQAAQTVAETAVLLGVPLAVLDHSVWKYMRQAASSK